MKRKDLDKVFTEKVAKYIDNGYTICTQTMTGHQGEEGKVDLVKGDELIRVWMNRENEAWTREDAYYEYKMVIRVGRWNQSASSIGGWTTAWMKDFETIEEVTFYSVSNNSDWYVATREEAMETQKKRYARYGSYKKYADNIIFSSEEAKEIASNYLKNHAGYKRVSTSDIVVARYISKDFSHSVYDVTYHGTHYRLK